MFKSNNINGQNSNSVQNQTNSGNQVGNNFSKQSLLINNNLNPIKTNNSNLILNNDDISSMRFINTKYKIYVLVLFLFIIWGYSFLVNAYDEYKASVSEYDSKVTYFQNEYNKYKKYKTQTQFINDITKKQKDILDCLNLDNGCNLVDKEMAKKIFVVRNYLQLGTLKIDKMQIIDERKVLQHFNEFLLVENPFSQTKKRNGEFVSIDIEKPSLVKGDLYKIPISMQVTFPTKDHVLSFLRNLEKRIYRTELYGFDKTILYKIEELNYDIMNYETNQDVDIKLTAFFLDGKYSNKKK